MITLKRLKRAATECAADTHTNIADVLTYGQAMFIHGAIYQSQKVWHKPKERPTTYFKDDKVTLLFLRNNNASSVETFTRQQLMDIFPFRDFRNHDKTILAWAYLEEIKP